VNVNRANVQYFHVASMSNGTQMHTKTREIPISQGFSNRLIDCAFGPLTRSEQADGSLPLIFVLYSCEEMRNEA
jgi:hypothetical protein